MELLWSAVLEAWEDERRHVAFVTYCRERNALGDAATRYRAIAEQAPGSEQDEASGSERRAIAKKQLASIAALALATLGEAQDADRSAAVKRTMRVASFVIFLVAMGVLVWALSLGGRPSE